MRTALLGLRMRELVSVRPVVCFQYTKPAELASSVTFDERLIQKQLDLTSSFMQMCMARRVNLLLWYNAWPEHHAPESWERRFIFLGRWLCCQAAPSAQAHHEP